MCIRDRNNDVPALRYGMAVRESGDCAVLISDSKYGYSCLLYTSHWDEGQVERSGKDVIHNPTVPYMVPTVSFSEYLTERMKIAVDMGVEAIHVEEPEFWDRSGYSEAFKREYEIYYKEPWRPQHEDLDVQYKSARLKAYLYSLSLIHI